jgi:hypothetical protein
MIGGLSADVGREAADTLLAVVLSDAPEKVSAYLATFPKTGMDHLGLAL